MTDGVKPSGNETAAADALALPVLVVGAPGSGKASLVRALVEAGVVGATKHEEGAQPCARATPALVIVTYDSAAYANGSLSCEAAFGAYVTAFRALQVPVLVVGTHADAVLTEPRAVPRLFAGNGGGAASRTCFLPLVALKPQPDEAFRCCVAHVRAELLRYQYQ